MSMFVACQSSYKRRVEVTFFAFVFSPFRISLSATFLLRALFLSYPFFLLLWTFLRVSLISLYSVSNGAFLPEQCLYTSTLHSVLVTCQNQPTSSSSNQRAVGRLEKCRLQILRPVMVCVRRTSPSHLLSCICISHRQNDHFPIMSITSLGLA